MCTLANDNCVIYSIYQHMAAPTEHYITWTSEIKTCWCYYIM